MALLTQAEFKKQNPSGNYRRYLRYVAKKGGPQMKQAASAALKKGKKTGGGGGGASSQPWIEPYTLQQIQALAQQLTQSALLPQQQALDLAQQEYMAQAQAQQQAITGYAQDAAGQLGQIGPRVQGVYQDAASAQAGFAKGFSDGLRQLAEQQAAEQTRILEQQGAPASQIAQLQGLSGDSGSGDVLYGLGGYLPAASLGREGAAWSSAAHALPSVALSQGQEGLRAAQWEAAQQGKSFRAQLADLAAQAPGIYQTTMQSLLGNEREKWAARLAAEQFGFDVDQQAFENKVTLTQLQRDAAAAARAAADAAAERNALRKKARNEYLSDIGDGINRAFKEYLSQLGPGSSSGGGEGGLNTPPGGATASAPKPDRAKAAAYIYSVVRSKYERQSKTGWAYRVSDKLVRRKIQEFLDGVLGVGAAGGSGGGAAGGPPIDMASLLDPNQYLAP